MLEGNYVAVEKKLKLGILISTILMKGITQTLVNKEAAFTVKIRTLFAGRKVAGSAVLGRCVKCK